MIKKVIEIFLKLLTSTKFTLLFCSFLLCFTLLIRGSLFDFMKVKTIEKEMEEEIRSIEMSSKKLKKQLEIVEDPKFIEKKVKEQLYFAEEGDLVFIFSEKFLEKK